jgi:hypothetical protein
VCFGVAKVRPNDAKVVQYDAKVRPNVAKVVQNDAIFVHLPSLFKASARQAGYTVKILFLAGSGVGCCTLLSFSLPLFYYSRSLMIF